MPPKTIFSKNDDQIIPELFDIRLDNGWSNIEIERQFLQRTNRRLAFRTLNARFNEIKFGQQNSINQVSNDQPGTSAFLDNNDIRIQHNDHQDDSSQPITSLVHQEAVANITSELEHNLSLVDHDDAANTVPKVSSTAPDTANIRRRGRPVNSKSRRRRRSPLTIRGEDMRKRANNGINRALRERIRRANETPEQRLERLSSQSRRQRERRANQTAEELNVRLHKNAQRQRDKRSNETPEQRERRLQYQRDYRAGIRENKKSD